MNREEITRGLLVCDGGIIAKNTLISCRKMIKFLQNQGILHVLREKTPITFNWGYDENQRQIIYQGEPWKSVTYDIDSMICVVKRNDVCGGLIIQHNVTTMMELDKFHSILKESCNEVIQKTILSELVNERFNKEMLSL